MRDVDVLLAVEKGLPIESDLALTRFISMNPHWQGAAWADCLESLLDSDSNLNVTEPVHEALQGLVTDAEGAYIGAVALTLYYAHPERYPSPFDVQGKLPYVVNP